MPITTEPSPNPPPNGTARIRLLGDFGDTSWGIGFWANIGGVPVTSDLVDLATDFYGAFESDLLPALSSTVRLLESRFRYHDGMGNPEVSIAAIHAGGRSANAAPANAAQLLTWDILETYRGGHPRTYLPGIGDPDMASERLLQDAQVTRLQDGAAAFLEHVNAFTTTNVDLVNLGTVAFFRAGVALDPPRFESFASVRAQKRVCTQRRRLGPELF